MRASDITLVCDTCGHAITDLNAGEVAWQDASEGRDVETLCVVHKRCAGDLSGSIELAWLADPQSALDQLGRLRGDFAWTPKQLRRLTRLTWLVPHLATPAVRAASRRWAAMRTGAGL